MAPCLSTACCTSWQESNGLNLPRDAPDGACRNGNLFRSRTDVITALRLTSQLRKIFRSAARLRRFPTHACVETMQDYSRRTKRDVASGPSGPLDQQDMRWTIVQEIVFGTCALESAGW
jgi:hypothetical protein